MNGQDEDDDVSEIRPHDTAFKQQRMRALQPIVTPAWAVSVFMTVGVLFVPLGTWLKLQQAKVVEIVQQYDGEGGVGECAISAEDEGKQCQMHFSVEEDMDGPVYVYYELQKFYQNHRNYVKSRSYDQLEGGEPHSGSCNPLETVGSLELSPCGLVANSMFNDVFVVDSAPDPHDRASPYSYMDESEVTWVTDRDGDFAQPDAFVTGECDADTSCEDCLGSVLYSECGHYTDARTGVSSMYWYPDDASKQYLYETFPQVIDPIRGVTDERFIAWMRTAASPRFRKLYGRIRHSLLAPATISFNVTANFHVADFGGTKSLVLTTLSPIGNRNGALGGAFMAVGGACLAAGLVVLSKFQRNPRDLGDVALLEWRPS